MNPTRIIPLAIIALVALVGCSIDPNDPGERALAARPNWDNQTPEFRAEMCLAWNTDPEGTTAQIESAMSVTDAGALIIILYTDC